MKITANTKAVQLINAEEFLSGAYNDITIDVELSEEYRSLTSFVTFNDKKTPVIAGKVSTPCLGEGLCRIGVYAVNIDDNNVVLRYSPKPVDVLITTGTWNNRIAESDTPTASEAEKIYTLIDNAIAAGQLKGDKGEPFKYSDFTPEQLEGLRGPQGKPGLKGQKGDSYILTDADKTEIAQKVKLPTKTSELENDSNFVSDENYIHTDNNFTNEEKTKLENDVATKDYVEQEIATFDFIKIVEALPEQGLPNRTYFVPKTDQQTNDLYDEYMWVNSKWEFVGTRQIEVDLTNYVKNTDFATTIKGGIVQIAAGGGLVVDNNKLRLDPASTIACKLGIYSFVSISPAHQHEAAFYGLAKAAGDTTQSESSNAVGNYTDEAKSKIQNMLGVQPKFELGNGLQLVDGVLSLDIPMASASTTYGGGDAQ